jgi:serine/threonine-protein phosphatase 2A activator
MLNDISALPEWRKVNSGLIKMYHAEVLHKFVVVQHFLFGTILPFEPVSSPTQQSKGSGTLNTK